MLNPDYWFIFPLALFGAIVANATGAGGGVVFVPAFHMLGIEPNAIIATSFAIQCFGMTAGMFAWRRLALERQMSKDDQERKIWQGYQCMILRLIPAAVLGVVIGQYCLSFVATDQVKWLFKSFSILFGLTILATTFYLTRRSDSTLPMTLTPAFQWGLKAVCLVGGIITAWLSIGVGELIAVMLILMRFPVRYAIGVAVSISAVSVWVGVQYYLWIDAIIDLDVLLFAAPAALIGGSVAKRVVSYFSAIQLKVFIALWILSSAVAM